MKTRLLFTLLASLTTLSLTLSAQPAEPKAPPQGNRKDPGLFGGGPEKKKKGEDENVRAVGGQVKSEADEAVEGAVVQLKDTKSLKVKSYITKADGMYRFFGLSNNVDYELKAAYKGKASESRTLSVYDGRKQAIINLKLQPKTDAAQK